MRIIYFINGFDPGGAEHGLLTLIENGFFDGHELRVLGMCRGKGALAERIRHSVGTRHFRIVEDSETLGFRAILRGAMALAAEIRGFRPDAVVLSLKQANVVGRFVLMAFPGISCISFEHISRYRARRAEGIYGYLLRAVSGRVDEVWADCQETLNSTRSYFKPRLRREAVVPLFCADDQMPAKNEYAMGPVLKLAGAGRLVDRKNFDQVIHAVKALNEAGRPVELTILGDGPELEPLRRLVEKLGLAARVFLPGYRPRWFEAAMAADIFINASDTEGFCIVVAEALAVGLPVIATDVGGIREYGVDGENMLKLKHCTARELVATISRAADDAILRRSIGQRARSDMRRLYSADALRQSGRAVLRKA